MKKTSVLIVAHGSRDKASLKQFRQLVALYRKKHPSWKIAYGYLELARPSLKEALAKMAKECDRVVLLPHFLFDAVHVKKDIPRVVSEVRSRFPKVKFKIARALGAHPSLLEVMENRVQETLGALSSGERRGEKA